jgi:hypothetical protein
VIVGLSGEEADGYGADSTLWFQHERGGDRIKHCRNMKRRLRARLDSMRMKCDTAWWRRPEERRHRGEDDVSWVDVNLTVKNEEILHSRFSCYKWMLKI